LSSRSIKKPRSKPSPATKDFVEVLQLLKSRHLIPTTPHPDLLKATEKLHCLTYNLALWAFMLKKEPECAQVFIDEMASDALQILTQALYGYRKTTALLLRSIVENVLRHIYFKHHPIEFVRMNGQKKWYPSVEELFDYLQHHPHFTEIEKRFDAISQFKTLYDDLSAEVHGRKMEHLEMRKALKDIALDQAVLEKQLNLLRRCAAAANFLLLHFHRKPVHHFPVDFKLSLLGTLPKKGRQAWYGLA
jgi:hypothetical protein